MPGLAESPFAALTIVVAPAILTNASSVLCLGTGNRIARVVDRTRALRAELAVLPVESDRRPGYMLQLSRLTARAQLLLQAMQWFYASIGAFAAAALVSIVGTLFASVLGEVVLSRDRRAQSGRGHRWRLWPRRRLHDDGPRNPAGRALSRRRSRSLDAGRRHGGLSPGG